MLGENGTNIQLSNLPAIITDNNMFQGSNFSVNRSSTHNIGYRNHRQDPEENGIEVEGEMGGGWRVLRREYFWDRCPPDDKCPWFLHDKPLTLLVVVIALNWLLCFIFAHIFIEFEGPAQKVSKEIFQNKQ